MKVASDEATEALEMMDLEGREEEAEEAARDSDTLEFLARFQRSLSLSS